MKIFKSLLFVGVLTLCFASCSRHTTCSAYSSIYQVDDTQNDVKALVLTEQAESM